MVITSYRSLIGQSDLLLGHYSSNSGTIYSSNSGTIYSSNSGTIYTAVTVVLYTAVYINFMELKLQNQNHLVSTAVLV